MADIYDIDPEIFGRHVRSLRKARGLTQEQLARRAGLSSDTIRRLENATFSPSLNTLVSLSRGLELCLKTVLESLDLGELRKRDELLELVRGCSDEEIALIVRVVKVLIS